MRYRFRIALVLLAASFMIGGLIRIGVYVGAAFSHHDFSLPILSLSVLFIVIIILIVLLLRNWQKSREFSRYCPDCAMKY